MNEADENLNRLLRRLPPPERAPKYSSTFPMDMYRRWPRNNEHIPPGTPVRELTGDEAKIK